MVLVSKLSLDIINKVILHIREHAKHTLTPNTIAHLYDLFLIRITLPY